VAFLPAEAAYRDDAQTAIRGRGPTGCSGAVTPLRTVVTERVGTEYRPPEAGRARTHADHRTRETELEQLEHGLRLGGVSVAGMLGLQPLVGCVVSGQVLGDHGSAHRSTGGECQKGASVVRVVKMEMHRSIDRRRLRCRRLVQDGRTRKQADRDLEPRALKAQAQVLDVTPHATADSRRRGQHDPFGTALSATH
jgi:hypothetical protein